MARLLGKVLSAVICLTFLASCASPNALSQSPTIFLVRHAEKQPGDDPLLTAEGELRAERLGQLMVEAGVSTIYSTQTRRTEATAAPAADALGLEVLSYDAIDMTAFAEQLKTLSGSVLVVGHSNTTPVLAALLTGRDEGPWFDEADYESLFRIEVNGAGEAVAYLLSYDSLALSLD